MEPVPGKFRLFVVWQSLVVRNYRSFFAALKQNHHLQVALAAPDRFPELGGQLVACAPFVPGESSSSYVLQTLRFHVQAVVFRGLRQALRHFLGADTASGPRTVMCVAEPYSITALLVWLCARMSLSGSWHFLLYAAQNIFKPLPYPLRLVQKMMFARADAVLSIGAEQDEVLRRHGYKGRIIRFPLWYNSSEFRLLDPGSCRLLLGSLAAKIPMQGPVVGYVGSITTEKGVFDLIESFRHHVRAGGRGYLVCAGGGAEADRLGLLLRTAELRDRAVWLGPVEGRLMPALLNLMDIVVVPSRTTAWWKEQFGRIIIEARACGAVVAGSNSGAIPSLITDRSRIFPEDDIAALTGLLGRLTSAVSAAPQETRALRQQEAAAAVEFSDLTLAAVFAAQLSGLADGSLQPEQKTRSGAGRNNRESGP